MTLSATTTVTAAFTSGTSSSSTLSVENVIWTDPVNVTATGNSIQKTSGCDGCEDAGAISQQQILSGDGYLEFIASETPTLRFVSFVGDTGTGSAEIRFAIKLESGIAEVRESGTARTTTGFVSGDVFRISVQSGVVKYYKNGVLFYTSGLASAYPLLADSNPSQPRRQHKQRSDLGRAVHPDRRERHYGACNLRGEGRQRRALRRATIIWTTNKASDSQVEYGPTTAYGSSTARNASLVTSHSQTFEWARRKRMTLAERRAASRRMKAYWG